MAPAIAVIFIAVIYYIIVSYVFTVQYNMKPTVVIGSIALAIATVLFFDKFLKGTPLAQRGLSLIGRLQAWIERYKLRSKEKWSSLKIFEIKELKIVRKVNWEKVEIKAIEVEEALADHCLIKKIRHFGSGQGSYSFEYTKFFSPTEIFLKSQMFMDFYKKYRDLCPSGYAIISRSNTDYARIFYGTDIYQNHSIRNSFIETIHWDDINMEKGGKLFPDLKRGAKVVIIQPCDEGDGFLDAAINYIKNNSDVDIAGIMTFFSLVDTRSELDGNLTENVLIELNLFGDRRKDS